MNEIFYVWTGIAYSLRNGWFDDRITMGARFFAPAKNSPGAYPLVFTMTTMSFSQAVKRQGGGVDYTFSSSSEFKNKVQLYLYSSSGPSWPFSRMTFTFTFTFSLFICSIPGGSVGIVIDYGLDGPGIESRWGEVFRPSRPALRPTQPPVQWVLGLSQG